MTAFCVKQEFDVHVWKTLKHIIPNFQSPQFLGVSERQFQHPSALASAAELLRHKWKGESSTCLEKPSPFDPFPPPHESVDVVHASGGLASKLFYKGWSLTA